MKLQTAHVNLNHMICPAILDPFQGSNYRLLACMHQMLLCPIVSKSFGYFFSPDSTDTNKIDEIASHEDIADNKRKKNTSHQIEEINSSQVQKMRHNIVDDINNVPTHDNVVWHKQALHNECHEKNVNGKQIENGCDIGNSLLDGKSIQCPNDSNKKIQ